MWGWWRVVELLLIAQYGLGSRGNTRASLVPRQPIEYDAFGESVMLPRPAFYRQLRSGEIAPDIRSALNFSDDGLYLHRQIVHPAVESLAFVGYASTVTSVLTYNLQAR